MWSRIGVHGMFLQCSWYYNNNVFDSCWAPAGNLDCEHSACQHTKKTTEALIKTYNVATLWSEYGIFCDIIVGLLLLIHIHIYLVDDLALYKKFPPGRYSSANLTQFTSPNNKRCLQRPLCSLGWSLSGQSTWEVKSKSNPWWYWSSVCDIDLYQSKC